MSSKPSLFQQYHQASLTFALKDVTSTSSDCLTSTLKLRRGRVALDEDLSHQCHFLQNGHFVAHLNSESTVLVSIHPDGITGSAAKVKLTSDGSAVQTVQSRYELWLQHKYEVNFRNPATGEDSSWFQIHIERSSKGVSRAVIFDPNRSQDFNECLRNGSYATLHKAEDGDLHIDVDFSNIRTICGWHKGTLKLSNDYSSLTGTMCQCSSEGDIGDSVSLFGSQKDCRKDELCDQQFEDPSHAERLSQLIANDLPMSVNELVTLPAPNTMEIHKATFRKVLNMAKSQEDEDLLNSLLSQSVPKLTDDEKAILSESDDGQKAQTFLKNKFFPAYGCEVLASSSDSQKYFDADVDTAKKRIHYYWNGSGKNKEDVLKECASKTNNVLALEPSFTYLTKRAAVLSFSQLVVGLDRYQNSADPQSWANKLYDYLTSKDSLKTFIYGTKTSLPAVNKLCMTLSVLDKTNTLATKFTEKLCVAQCNELRKYSGSFKETNMAVFLHDLMHYLAGKVDAGDRSAFSPELADELFDSFKNVLESKDETSQTAVEFVEKYKSVWNELASCIYKYRGRPALFSVTKFLSTLKLTTLVPKAILQYVTALVGKLAGVSVLVFSTMASMLGLVYLVVDWNSLRVDKKIALIAPAVVVIAKLFASDTVRSAFRQLIETFKFENATAIENALNSDSMQEVLRENLTTVAEENPEIEALGMESGAISAAAGVTARTDTSFTRFSFFSIAEKAIKPLTIMAQVAAIVSLGFEIAKDFSNDVPMGKKVLDIINIVATGLAATAEAIAYVAEISSIELGVLLSETILPIVGVVLAIVGIIVSILTMFFLPKPKDPVKDWMDDSGNPFINGLATPTDQWLKDNKVRNG